MEPMRQRAEWVVATTALAAADLKSHLHQLFGHEEDLGLAVTVCSFGFKYGIPREADLVFDVRFLPNPYYVEELTPLSGLDQPVSDFVMGLKDAQKFLEKLTDLADFLLPLYQEEGKQSLTIGIGCTGGRHRSVALARALTEHLIHGGHNARLINRDLGKVNEQ